MSIPSDPVQTGLAVLGHIDWDNPSAVNERVILRAVSASRARILRDQFVRIEDCNGTHSSFLGRIIGGPPFPGDPRHGHGRGPGLAAVATECGGAAGPGPDTRNRLAPASPLRDRATNEHGALIGSP